MNEENLAEREKSSDLYSKIEKKLNEAKKQLEAEKWSAAFSGRGLLCSLILAGIAFLVLPALNTVFNTGISLETTAINLAITLAFGYGIVISMITIDYIHLINSIKQRIEVLQEILDETTDKE